MLNKNLRGNPTQQASSRNVNSYTVALLHRFMSQEKQNFPLSTPDTRPAGWATYGRALFSSALDPVGWCACPRMQPPGGCLQDLSTPLGVRTLGFLD